MASFFIPLTGLQADSTALNTIANNLANMSTTAYKSQTTSFSDLFYQNIGVTGAGNSIQLGAGVQVASNSTDFTAGTPSSTNNATDMALTGDGFFVVSNGGGGYEYTRAGNFSLSSTGNLQTNSGLSVMGYPAANGVVNTNAPLKAINIPIGQVMAPRATGSTSINANLYASASTGASLQAPETVYDSLGNSHTLTITYTKTGTNTWSYSASLPASDFTSGTSTPITGTLGFDSNGNLATVTPTAGVPTPVGTAAGDISSIPLAFNGLADGSANLSINWNLLNSSNTPTISQVTTSSSATATAGGSISSTTQDGNASGNYSSFSVDTDGTVTVSYSNGKQQAVGQIAVATVNNQQGLEKLGNGNYATTQASGTASAGIAGTSGRSAIKDNALEGSNVSISSQFSALIIAQRAFEASSKAVTTFDTVTGDTISMIR